MEQDKGKEWSSWSDPTLSCDPFRTAHQAKYWLEEGADGLVFVFDPNGDNAFLMGGNSKNANAIWLLNWLKALGRAKASGGRVIQIIVPGGKDVTDDNPEGLSHMQKAEALMASMWGVEVVKLDCRGEGLCGPDRLREECGLGGAGGDRTGSCGRRYVRRDRHGRRWLHHTRGGDRVHYKAGRHRGAGQRDVR